MNIYQEQKYGIIDPEKEYKDMCKKIEGAKWIDCSRRNRERCRENKSITSI